VNEIFQELYGYHFDADEKVGKYYVDDKDDDQGDQNTPANHSGDLNTISHDATCSKQHHATTTVRATAIELGVGDTVSQHALPSPPSGPRQFLQVSPPVWLFHAMGNNNKHTQRVWHQLSSQRQQELLRLVIPAHNQTSSAKAKKRMYDNEMMQLPLSSSLTARRTNAETILQHHKKKRMDHDHTGSEATNSKDSHPATAAAESTGTLNQSSHNVTLPATTSTTTTATTTTNSTLPPLSSSNHNTKSNLSSLLQQLDGSKKITTIAKTAMDWEQYKDHTMMKETLEQHTTSTTAYLPKQEFLQRVDQRKYEQEKQQRLYEQGKNKK
jgi:hypothetical protein